MKGSLVCLAISISVMCFALDRLWRGGSRAQTRSQSDTLGRTGCRLAVLSSLMLAAAGIGLVEGAAWMLGWLMVILGSIGTVLGSVVFRLFLPEAHPVDRSRSR